MIGLNIAVVLAGGTGQRVGGDMPKQFMDINGIPMIIRKIKAFEEHDEIDMILVVCLEEWNGKLCSLLDKYNVMKVKQIVGQGNTRRESSFNAIKALNDVCKDDDIILIHDAARPNLSYKIIAENIRMAKNTGACETVIPVQDTIVVSMDGLHAHEKPSRDKLYIVQTPQSFKYSIIRHAHNYYLESKRNELKVPDITDDTGLLLFANIPVSLVEGDKFNIKVTSPEDFVLMEAIIK
jgi:2-C-methyl-D-erythritol 4-phosphate cytidylyltransferase